MCVKCGISSCGSCDGKSCDVSLTGDITYDGLPITCVTDSSINIDSGDKLNDVIQTILVGLCPPTPVTYLTEVYYEDSGAAQPMVTPMAVLPSGDLTFTITEDATYRVTSVFNMRLGPAESIECTLFVNGVSVLDEPIRQVSAVDDDSNSFTQIKKLVLATDDVVAMAFQSAGSNVVNSQLIIEKYVS